MTEIPARFLALPPGTTFAVLPGGQVRHIWGPTTATWCRMVTRPEALVVYGVKLHGELPICRACLRTSQARNNLQ